MNPKLFNALRAVAHGSASEPWETMPELEQPFTELIKAYPIAPREALAILTLVGELAATGIPPSRVFDAIARGFNVGQSTGEQS